MRNRGHLAEIARIAWQRFNIIGKIIGEVNGRIFITIFYFTIVMPFAIGSRLFTDPLRQRNPQSVWLERPPIAEDLEAARQQG